MNKRLIGILTSKLGRYHIRKGTELCFKCPRCNDSKHRLEVNPSLGFNCFHCGWNGRMKELLDNIGEGLDLENEAEVKMGITAPSISKEISLPKGFVRAFDEEHTNYLRDRGIDPFLALAKGWGHCQNSFRLSQHIIIPILEQRKIVCWVARDISKDPHPLLTKELSPSSQIANKSHFLYNLDGIDTGDKLLIVEGIFDCEKMISYGFKSVAILGSHLSKIQAGKILSKKPDKIYLVFDGDLAGVSGTLDAFLSLVERYSAKLWDIHRIYLPSGRDPKDMSYAEMCSLLKI